MIAPAKYVSPRRGSTSEPVYAAIVEMGQQDSIYPDREAIRIRTGLRNTQVDTAIDVLRRQNRLPKPGRGRRPFPKRDPTRPSIYARNPATTYDMPSRPELALDRIHGHGREAYCLPAWNPDDADAVAAEVSRWKVMRRRAVLIHTYIEESRARDSGKAAMVRVDVMVSEGEGRDDELCG